MPVSTTQHILVPDAAYHFDVFTRDEALRRRAILTVPHILVIVLVYLHVAGRLVFR
jgi:hypothetical protein